MSTIPGTYCLLVIVFHDVFIFELLRSAGFHILLLLVEARCDSLLERAEDS